MRTNHKKAYEKSVEIVDRKIDEIRIRKMNIFKKLCDKVSEDVLINMSIEKRVLELKKIAFKNDDFEMKYELANIDELDAILEVLKDVKEEMNGLIKE